MILYFSGTGNSKFVALKLAKEIGDESLNLFKKLRKHDYYPLSSDKPWVIVVPTYAWRIPKIVENWLRKTQLTGNQTIYFILTCGGSIGNATFWLKKLCDTKGLYLYGCAEVIMPENYIALYSAPDKVEALNIIEKAESKLSTIAQHIKSGHSLEPVSVDLKGKICSGPINSLFYRFMVKSNKFYVTKRCISCGKCVLLCPLENIHLKNNTPIWGKHCTHCMACINYCPTKAIEYGNHTRGLQRYTCPK